MWRTKENFEHYPMILENLEIQEILEIPSVKRPFLNDPSPFLERLESDTF